MIENHTVKSPTHFEKQSTSSNVQNYYSHSYLTLLLGHNDILQLLVGNFLLLLLLPQFFNELSLGAL